MDRYRHPIGVRYLEVDRLGIVFNMWYLGWFDDALAGWMAARGLPYPHYLADGFDLALVHTEIDWTAGAGFGDRVEVEVSVQRVGTTSFTLGFEVFRLGDGGEQSVCRAATVYVVVGDGETAKREIPPALRRCLDAG